ncbi:MAG TPA: DUF4105 domain-containing protein [Gemmatimonadaceae bacterium]|nr:DUF4105 domain-containing protein [Gemmatimonadaceae bacterium]
MKPCTLLRSLAFSVSVGTALQAQPIAQSIPTGQTMVPAPAEPGSNLTVYLLTFGWGDVVWERFGHNAIWIKDRSRGTDITYNWGMFDFNQPHFIQRFLTGDTRYWMEAIPLQPMLTYYKERNRSVLAQELNLTPAQRLKLQQFVEWNSLPQNKFYRYDYYRDNCSTRLRDAIDRAVGGQLQTGTVSRMTSGTYRWHTQRLMTGDIPLYTGVSLALGHPADKPLSMWEEMFLPVRMANNLRKVTLADSTGSQIPIVRSEMAMFTAGRPPEPSSPPYYLPLFVAAGIIVAALLVLLVRSAEGGGRVALFVATALATLWSLVAGAGGLALVFAWLFTKHHFMSRNENLLHFDPLSVALVILIPLSIYGLRGVSRAVKFAGFIAALSLFGFVLQGLPFFNQKNGEIIALALPMNLSVWWTVYRLTSYRRTSFPSSAAL